MKNEITIQEFKAQPVLAIRLRTKVEDLPQVIGQSYASIMGHLNKIGVQPADAPYTAYYNLDMSDLDVEMGFPVVEMQQDAGDIKAGLIPAGKAVTYMYKGAYSAMEGVYNELFAWLNEKGCKATGVCYEYYYNSPNEVPESELLTKIVLPVI